MEVRMARGGGEEGGEVGGGGLLDLGVRLDLGSAASVLALGLKKNSLKLQDKFNWKVTGRRSEPKEKWTQEASDRGTRRIRS